MPRAISCLLAATSLCGDPAGAGPDVETVDRPPTPASPAAPPLAAPAAYPVNRAPLAPGRLIKLPVGAFRPSGWLGRMLELQRDGLTGRLGEISIWLTKKDNAWLRTDGGGEYGWEEVPYWLRGYVRIAHILGDAEMLAESKVWIEQALASQRDSGDFGPIQMKKGRRDLWAQMIMLQVLQAHHEATGDERILPFMSRYFRWQLTIPDEEFLQDYWERSRGGDNLASVYWLYNRTGEGFLLELATKIDRNTADWRQQDNLPNWHVVNIAECFRAPATYALQSGRAEDIEASYRAHNLARERYGQVPGGMFGADENARPGHTDPHQAAETCAFVEQIWSNLIMTEITGDPFWAANTEDVAFNSLPAAFTPDYRALRYLTAPNHAVSDAANHAPGIANRGPFFLMNPFSSRCCQHNHSSSWVNFVEHAWMATADRGLCAVLYAPGTLTARVGAGAAAADNVALRIDTRYPFDEEVRITIDRAPEEPFPLYLRVPGWTEGRERATLALNGMALDIEPRPGAYLRVHTTFRAGDTLVLTLPMPIRIRTWERNKQSVSIDRGPLTFSLQIDEQYRQVESDKTAIRDSSWQPTADTAKWPSFEILPASPWNYALLLAAPESGDPARGIEVIRRPWPESDEPFTNAAAPIQLRIQGKRLPGWTLDEHGLAAALPQSPVHVEGEPVDLILTPMGGARLRISAFPVVRE